MKFSEAVKALEEGKKIKRPSWAGYWVRVKDIYNPQHGKYTIHMHCRDGRVLDIRDTQDVFYTIGNMVAEDWEIAE